MASKDVNYGKGMEGDSEMLVSTVESWVSTACGRVEATEEVVFPERRRCMTLSDFYDLTSDEINNNNNEDDFNFPIYDPALT